MEFFPVFFLFSLHDWHVMCDCPDRALAGLQRPCSSRSSDDIFTVVEIIRPEPPFCLADRPRSRLQDSVQFPRTPPPHLLLHSADTEIVRLDAPRPFPTFSNCMHRLRPPRFP